jgi:ribonuclease E
MPAVVAEVAAPIQIEAPMPKLVPFVLPVASLVEVAQSSGLQWVGSDPEKVAHVQAAIAAEPKPVHVPRERAPAVVQEDGPLVLVETRKDLKNMNLPF